MLNFFNSFARPGIVRYLKSTRNLKMSLNKSSYAHPGTRQCPSGYWPMFYELNCHLWEATCICRSTHCIYCIYIDISLLKTKNINTKNEKNIYCFSSWVWIICNEHVLLIFCSLVQVWFLLFTSITVRVSLNLSYFNKLFLWRNYDNFWY